MNDVSALTGRKLFKTWTDELTKSDPTAEPSPSKIVDDRTDAQKLTHSWLIIGTDQWMSGWGQAAGISSYAAWACKPDDADRVFNWVNRRGDMTRVREADANTYRPSGVHLHIYHVHDKHNALK